MTDCIEEKKLYENSFEIVPVKRASCKPKKDKEDFTEANLILNFPQNIEPYVESGDFFQKENTPASSTVLTDGHIPTDGDYTTGQWFKIFRSEGRRITYDLKYISTVYGFRAVFLNKPSDAVYLPFNFRFLLSENGVDWQVVYESKKFSLKYDQLILDINEKLDESYRARFARFEFSMSIWAMCGDLEVIGTKGISKEAKKIVPTPIMPVETINVDKYLMPEDFFDIHDIMLAYNCRINSPENGRLTVEQLLPYVGYYNKEDKLSDTFFDSYLFLPYTAGFQGHASNCERWQCYLDDLFMESYNTDALDYATMLVRNELNLPDYKTKVFLSILYPFEAQKEFGVVNGEKLDFSNFEDRVKAVKWFIDTELMKFNERNYSHCELKGFYWFEECINLSDESEERFLKWVTDYVRSLGYVTIWIPYFMASGYNEWSNYGIDFACMQPNYAFRDTSDWVIYETARITKKYGMCVEMEIGGVAENNIDKYNAYLLGGVKTGYMNAVHMYYQGGGPGEFYKAYKSDNEKLNNLYHNNYKFVKHTLEEDFI